MIRTRWVMGLRGWRRGAALALALLGPLLAGVADAAAKRTAVDLDARGRFGGAHRGTRDAHLEQRQAYVYYGKDEIDTLQGATGAITIQVTRTVEIHDRDYKPIVLFEEADGDLPLEIQLSWEHPGAEGRTMLVLGGNGKGYGIWGHWVDLGRTVGVGETATISLSWGESPLDNRVFLDGREATYLNERKDTFGSVFARVTKVAVYSPLARTKMDKEEFPYNEDFEVAGVTFFDAPLFGGPPPELTAVSHDAALKAGFSGKLVAGNVLEVTLQGTPGVTGSFDILPFPDIDRKIALDWRGWGVYLEEKIFYEPGEVDLREVRGYRVYASLEPIDLASLSAVPVEGTPPPLEPIARLDVKEQFYTLESLEIDRPYYVAVLAEMRDGTLRRVIAPLANREMAESAPGVYTGTYQVRPRDRYPRAVLVGHLANEGGTATLAGGAASLLALDASLTIAVATEPNELKADEKSVSKVTVTVTDANGSPVPGHKLKFLLATTSQYTGVVGGGAFADQVGGSLQERVFGETDLFGRLTATYVAGFAAKTAVIVARDMTSNDTGAGYVKTYIRSTAELELEPVVQARIAAEDFTITVTSSDEWLTADGKSQARITAEVRQGGKPAEGRRVAFAISAGTGSLRTVSDTTGRDGKARAVYTAGTKIGVVLVTATDVRAGISASVPIELRSDAPAKIAIKLDPAKLPADGRSRADLQVTVTDINDNPNDNVEVEYAIAGGGGSLTEERTTTDRNGETGTVYVAGHSPGKVSIDITVRSTVPSDEEVAKARGLALAVTDYDFY